MNLLNISFFTQIILALYFQACNWFRLGSWNNQENFIPVSSQLSEMGVMDWGFLFTFILPAVLFWLGLRFKKIWLFIISLLLYLIWLGLQIQTWWISYIFGANEKWINTYNRVFSKTTKVLPNFGNHLAPDAMHLTIQVLLVIIIITAIRGLYLQIKSVKSNDMK